MGVKRKDQTPSRKPSPTCFRRTGLVFPNGVFAATPLNLKMSDFKKIVIRALTKAGVADPKVT
jgi:hypothetical protein